MAQVLAAFGLVSEGGLDADGGACYLWPESVDIWNGWQLLQTQWRVGFAGHTGLDYTAVAATLDMLGVKRRDRAEWLQCLHAMERAALDEWEKQRERTAGR